jgi:SAM-dependent methyltransferase
MPWHERLAISRNYYRKLLETPKEAAQAFTTDFNLLRDRLSTFRGRVLDVGGGNGLARAYLPVDAEYVCLEPERFWLDSAWMVLQAQFPCLAQSLRFVSGVGEAAPFPDATFDAVLAIFSLNHCRHPAQVVAEMARVLRHGGRALMILEDAEPPWRDVLSGAYGDWRGWNKIRVGFEKMNTRRGWPLEADHVRITEDDLQRWCVHLLDRTDRRWLGAYLAVELRRV